MLPRKRVKPSPISPNSTGDRYIQAGKRDKERMDNSRLGSSKHQFELDMRQARIDWGIGTKTLTPLNTPYGKVNLSKFPTKDPGPKITTRMADYNNTSVGHKYTDLAAALIDLPPTDPNRSSREIDVAAELLEAIKTGVRPASAKIADGRQANAAAKLLAISHLSEPERVGGSSKDFRSVLRQIVNRKRTFKEAFEEDGTEPPRFMMAKSPNVTRRALGLGKRKNAYPPSSFVNNDSDYSDDSS